MINNKNKGNHSSNSNKNKSKIKNIANDRIDDINKKSNRNNGGDGMIIE